LVVACGAGCQRCQPARRLAIGVNFKSLTTMQ
jgi:hypothetical protein